MKSPLVGKRIYTAAVCLPQLSLITKLYKGLKEWGQFLRTSVDLNVGADRMG